MNTLATQTLGIDDIIEGTHFEWQSKDGQWHKLQCLRRNENVCECILYNQNNQRITVQLENNHHLARTNTWTCERPNDTIALFACGDKILPNYEIVEVKNFQYAIKNAYNNIQWYHETLLYKICCTGEYNFANYFDIVSHFQHPQTNTDMIGITLQHALTTTQFKRLLMLGLRQLLKKDKQYQVINQIQKCIPTNHVNNAPKSLTENVLQLIFCHLRWKCLVPCMYVCKYWLKTIQKPQSKYHIETKDLFTFRAKPRYLSILQFKKVQSLTLSSTLLEVVWFEHKNICIEFQKFTSLTHLKIEKFDTQSTTTGLITPLILRNAKHLKTLCIMPYLGNSFLWHNIKKTTFPHLTHFESRGFPLMELLHQKVTRFPKLEELKFGASAAMWENETIQYILSPKCKIYSLSEFVSDDNQSYIKFDCSNTGIRKLQLNIHMFTPLDDIYTMKNNQSIEEIQLDMTDADQCKQLTKNLPMNLNNLKKASLTMNKQNWITETTLNICIGLLSNHHQESNITELTLNAESPTIGIVFNQISWPNLTFLQINNQEFYGCQNDIKNCIHRLTSHSKYAPNLKKLHINLQCRITADEQQFAHSQHEFATAWLKWIQTNTANVQFEGTITFVFEHQWTYTPIKQQYNIIYEPAIACCYAWLRLGRH